MLTHVVTFTFTESTTDAQVDALAAALAALPGQIDTIRDYRVGRDAGLDPANAAFAVIATFDDDAGYLVYRDHPVHRQVIVEHVRPILAGRSAVQVRS